MEEDNVPNERSVAHERVYNLLKSFEKDDFYLSNFINEGDVRKPFNMANYLFSVLKKCHENCHYDVSLKILKYLIENQQCGKKFIWKMFANFLQKDCNFFLPLYSDFIKLFLKGHPKVHHDEIFLFHSALLLNKEMYDRAHEVARKFNAKESKFEMNFLETSKAASTSLLMGYKTILDYNAFHPDDDNMLNVTKESFLLLFSKKTCEPLFAEPYVYILMKLELQEEAETFLEKYVEKESKGNMGISAALDALNIIKLHIPSASPKLVISFLEMIANRDSGNPKVLDLCQHHLNNLNSGMCSKSKMESDSDAGAISFATKLDGLKKCLQLIMYFLDVYVRHILSADIRKGWTVMAEIMRRICEQEAKDCFQTIIDLWHNDRKRWWPFFRFPPSGLPSSLSPDDAEFYSNKGIVCYILESQNHPFVVNLMEHQECSLLKSVVEQLRHPKMKFDLHIESLQKANEPVLEEPLVSKPIVPQMAVTNPQIQMTPSLSRFSAIDSEAIEKEFEKYLLTSRPVKPKHLKCNNYALKNEKILKLDVCNLISRRYANRKKIAPQRRALRMTRAKRADTVSVCSVRSLESLDSSMDEAEDDSDDIMTDDTISHDDENDDASKLFHGKPNPLIETDLAKKRWKTFIEVGKWDTFCVDDVEHSSDEEYAPPFFSDQDFYSDEFENELSEGEANTRAVISNNYPVSIPSSYPSISPASSTSGGCTPIPQFPNFSGQPRDIRNEDHCRFVEFDSFSICSNSTTEGIVNNIDQVIRKLDVDIHATTGMDHGADEYVVEEDILIPDEALVQSSSQNTILSCKSVPAAGGYAVEEVGLSEETTASNINSRDFSRDFEASSPDMFASFSEDKDQGAFKYFDENKECNHNLNEENRKATNSTAIYQKTPISAVSTSFIVSTPLAVSTPKAALKSKNKKKVVQSKKKQSTIATQNETNEQYAWERCSRSKQNIKHGASKSDEWKMSLVNSILKDSLVSQSSTSNLRKLSTVETETFMGAESCNQTGNYNRGVVEETLPSAAISSAKKPSLTKAKRMNSTAPGKGKSLDSLSTLADAEKMETESYVATYQPQPCPTNSNVKNLNVKKKRKPTMIHQENEINKQSASDSRSSKSKEKQGVSNVGEWQMSLIDLLLKGSFKESLLSQEKPPPTSLSKHSSAVDTLQPITVKTTGMKFRTETKKLASTSTVKGKSLVDDNVVEKSETFLPDADHQSKPFLIKSVPARKCHVRVRDSDYLSTSEKDSDVSAVSSSFGVPTPLLVSSPMTALGIKDKKVGNSKIKQLRKTWNSRSSGIKQKSKCRASTADRWNISLVNRVLKDSSKESPVYQGKSFSEIEEANSQDNVSILADAEKMGTESDVIAYQQQSCLPKSSVKKSAIKKRKNSTVIHQETPAKKSLLSSVSKASSVTTPFTVPTPKTVNRNEKRKKVNVKSETRPLRHSTHNETKKTINLEQWFVGK